MDDPYEAPLHPELALNTVDRTPEENARQIIEYLVAEGLLVEESRTRKADIRLATRAGQRP